MKKYSKLPDNYDFIDAFLDWYWILYRSKKMRLWVDDVRTPPSNDYKWVKNVHEAIIYICQMTRPNGTHNIEILDLDHDAGDYAWMGGDYIAILNWMEMKGINDIPIHIHSMNPVGMQNMKAIINKNNWREV